MIDPENLIGEKVIGRSNENEPAHVGVVTGWKEICGREFPLVQWEDGKTSFCMSVLFPYSPELLTFLNSIGPKAGWKLAHDFSVITQIRNRKS